MDLEELGYWFLAGLAIVCYAYLIYLWALEIRNGIRKLSGRFS